MQAEFINDPVSISLFDIFVALAFLSIMAAFIAWLRGGTIGDSEYHGQMNMVRKERRKNQ
jgi:hypothetical protein